MPSLWGGLASSGPDPNPLRGLTVQSHAPLQSPSFFFFLPSMLHANGANLCLTQFLQWLDQLGLCLLWLKPQNILAEAEKELFGSYNLQSQSRVDFWPKQCHQNSVSFLSTYLSPPSVGLDRFFTHEYKMDELLQIWHPFKTRSQQWFL